MFLMSKSSQLSVLIQNFGGGVTKRYVQLNPAQVYKQADWANESLVRRW